MTHLAELRAENDAMRDLLRVCRRHLPMDCALYRDIVQVLAT